MAKTLMTVTASAASGLFSTLGGAIGANANEVDAEMAITGNATISNLRRNISTGGDGTNTMQLRKNGANGNLVVSGPAGRADDTTHTDSFVGGDVVALAFTDTGSDPTYQWISANLEFGTGTSSIHAAGRHSTGAPMTTASVTRFFSVGGALQNGASATEAQTQWKVRSYTRIDAFQVRISANLRTTDVTFQLRVNGSNVAASAITVEAGTTGLFLVTGINQALSAGDLVCGAVTTSTGTEAITVQFAATTFSSSTNGSELFTYTANGTARAASATQNYYPLAGGINALTSITDNSLFPGFPADIQNVRLYVSANTYSADATISVWVNDVSVQTFTLTAGATGWIEDAVSKVTIGTNDKVIVGIVGGSTGSITIHGIGLSLNTPTPVNPSVTTKPRLSGGGSGFGPKRRGFAWPSFSVIEHD